MQEEGYIRRVKTGFDRFWRRLSLGKPAPNLIGEIHLSRVPKFQYTVLPYG